MTSLSIGLALTSPAVSGGTGGTPYDGPQIVIAGYGQSNWLRHVGFGSSPPAAAEGTFYWDGEAWGTVPAANGVRALLNAIRAATGRTVGLISGGHTGVQISALMPDAGTGYFEDLAAGIEASGAGNAPEHFVVFHQGEGDADSAAPTSSGAYAALMDELHGHIADALGTTRAACPFVCSSLGSWGDGSPGTATDASWNAILNAQVTAHATYPDIHYSHSNRQTTVLLDGAHWDLASDYGKSGANYARTILALRGDVATGPNWSIASVEIVDATHTDVHLAHSMGDDFTPTSGITGFTVSANGFSSSVTPSAADRVDGSTIRLTHSSLSITADRSVRYQYGLLPANAAPVFDNSALAVPLNHSAGQILIAEGSAAEPILVHRAANSDQHGNGGQTQGLNAVDLTITEDTSFIVAIAAPNDGSASASTVTLTPSGGSPISGTLLYKPSVGSSVHHEFWRVDVPGNTAGMSNVDLRVGLSVFPFARYGYAIASVNTGDVSSWTPVDTDSSAASDTVRSLDLTTSAGGFIYAIASSAYNGGATSATWSGDEPPVEANDFSNSFGINFTTAIANGTDGEASTVTCTYANSGAMRLTAISIR